MSKAISDQYYFPAPDLKNWSGEPPEPPGEAPHEEALVAVAERLYQAVLQPTAWPKAMEQLAQAMGAGGAQFAIADFQTRRMLKNIMQFVGGVTIEDAIQWEDTVLQEDPSAGICAAFPGHAFISRETLTPEAEQFRRQLLSIPPAAGQMLCVSWPLRPYWVAACVWRSDDDDPFEPHDRVRIASISRDLLAIAIVLTTQRRPIQVSRIDEAILNKLEFPAGIARGDGSINALNPIAQEWTLSSDNEAILRGDAWHSNCRRATRLGYAEIDVSERNLKIEMTRISSASVSVAGLAGKLIQHDYDSEAIFFEVRKLNETEKTSVLDKNSPHELTKSEIRVLCCLKSGFSVNEIAFELNVSRETVRTHLRALRRKTGSHSIAELIAL